METLRGEVSRNCLDNGCNTFLYLQNVQYVDRERFEREKNSQREMVAFT